MTYFKVLCQLSITTITCQDSQPPRQGKSRIQIRSNNLAATFGQWIEKVSKKNCDSPSGRAGGGGVINKIVFIGTRSN
jgi:hypothetical protein